MKKTIRLSESDLVKIISNIVNETKQSELLSEQYQFLRKYFGSVADDLIRKFDDGAVQNIESAVAKGLSNRANYVVKNGEIILLSKSGTEVPLETLNDVLKAVADGRYTMDEMMKYLPRQLADGTEFRSIFASLKPKSNLVSSSASAVVKGLGNHVLKNCKDIRFCKVTEILRDFIVKLEPTAKIFRFNPNKVKVLERGNVAGREVILVNLENGVDVLFYKSSGSNVATTGKKQGEWFVIPGFAEDGWFFKTDQTINLTKGANKYLTEMAEWLQTYGSNSLNKPSSEVYFPGDIVTF